VRRLPALGTCFQTKLDAVVTQSRDGRPGHLADLFIPAASDGTPVIGSMALADGPFQYLLDIGRVAKRRASSLPPVDDLMPMTSSALTPSAIPRGDDDDGSLPN
jgi:hypothetical protein